jgi:CheY-like chemotaxis protein
MNDKNVMLTANSANVPLSSPRRPSPCILVAEDDGAIRRLNTDVLSGSGYHVDAAEDGAAAWDTLQLKRYDLLVTDNEMPKVSGVELLKKIHAARLALPVIMATGTIPNEEFSRHPWILPAATLLKPYSVEDLLRAVQDVLLAVAAAREPAPPPPAPLRRVAPEEWWHE